jgi:hypothetical protein
MAVAGLTLPDLSAFDPPVAGEGSLDPVGLAAISDRLADRLAPGLRARMQRIRWVTATSVGAMACETLADTPSADGVSTPAIAFEWLVIEGFTRRLHPSEIPRGVPGSMKARGVLSRNQRLSAATYLKGPAVFGFNGVYKPFAVDSGVVGSQLDPGPRCAEVVRVWEQEQGFVGFSDAVPSITGGRLRADLRDQVRNALSAGRCTTKPSSWLFGHVARSLHPERAGPAERRVLRSLVTDGVHETRSELARHLLRVEDDIDVEAEALAQVRPLCSPALGEIVDAVVAYERFALLVDAAFRTLCAVSHSLGSQPLVAANIRGHETIVLASRELPSRFSEAADRMAVIGTEAGLEEQLGEFAIPRSPVELVELLFEHHERVQSAKPPGGKRPWFEPVRDGWVVRDPYATPEQPQIGPAFVHPVRVAALRRFMRDTAP